MHWRRKWQPTPVFLPGASQGRGSLVGCRLWGHTESDCALQLQPIASAPPKSSCLKAALCDCVCVCVSLFQVEHKLACAPQQPLVRAVCVWTTPTFHIPQSLSLRNLSLLREVFRVWFWFWFLAAECIPQGRHFLPLFWGPVISGLSKRKRS